jgi:hypothetical protein
LCKVKWGIQRQKENIGDMSRKTSFLTRRWATLIHHHLDINAGCSANALRLRKKITYIQKSRRERRPILEQPHGYIFDIVATRAEH